MNKISSTEELNTAILQLENQRKIQEQLVKEQLQIVYINLRPINIIKNTFKEAFSSQEVQGGILEYAVNLVADYVSTLFVKEKPTSFFRKYLGQLLHLGITTIIRLNSDTIKSFAESLINRFQGESNKQKAEL